VLGANGGQHRSNDDGEPSGTAGRPILQRIQAAGLTQCAVVVVRYFGGTLLGKGGLVKAYGESAAMALADAPVEQVMVRDMVRVRCGYDRLETVRNTVVRLDGEVIDAHYDAACYLLVALPRSMVHGQIEAWLAAGLYARPEGAEK
jgi:putative IMPACT (imprinted ancient) family translation regulator